jgi:hypothetical protein
MSQTGFLNNYAHGLVLAARYKDALEPLNLELAQARDFSLGFVLPYALLLKAWALMGLRRFEESRQSLESVAGWEAHSSPPQWPVMSQDCICSTVERLKRFRPWTAAQSQRRSRRVQLS